MCIISRIEQKKRKKKNGEKEKRKEKALVKNKI